MRRDKRENSIYLSLGTNLGDRSVYLKEAAALLQSFATEKIGLSEIYESKPWGNDLLNAFLNCVVHLKTSLDPLSLLQKTQEIEKVMGRLEKTKGNEYQNRVIDIDILTYNYVTIDSLILTIPHPLLTKRRFVLLPFLDLAPRFLLPYDSQSIEKHLLSCEDDLECNVFELK